jgi:hypothetical protein
MNSDKKKVIAGAAILGGAGLVYLLSRKATGGAGETWASLSGVVTDKDTGDPIEGIRVYCGGIYNTLTGPTGQYNMDRILCRSQGYTITFSDPNQVYQGAAVEKTLVAGVNTQDMQLTKITETPSDWSAGLIINSITASPLQAYVGEEVRITVDVSYPGEIENGQTVPGTPWTFPAIVNGKITVDGTELTGSWAVTFACHTFDFFYKTTEPGTFTARAEDKYVSFVVLENTIATYYSPFGGTRMPLCTDIVFPDVAAFTLRHGTIGDIIFDWPGGDLKYSDMIGSGWGSGPSWFFLGSFSMVPQIISRLPYAEPCAWDLPDADVTLWVKKVDTGLYWMPPNSHYVLVMATEYTSQPYWDSKQDLAEMIAHFIGTGLRLDSLREGTNDWCSIYGHYVTCPTCGGTGKVNYGKRICPTCGGTGQVWLCRIDLGCGLRDWVKNPNFNAFEYANTPFTIQINCPYCGVWITRTYADNPGASGKLDLARALIEHIEIVHPDHPLTEPAWF